MCVVECLCVLFFLGMGIHPLHRRVMFFSCCFKRVIREKKTCLIRKKIKISSCYIVVPVIFIRDLHTYNNLLLQRDIFDGTLLESISR